MALNLPVQGVIDRSRPYEPFMVLSAFKDDGVPSLYRHQVGGAYGHDPGDPTPWQCRDAQAYPCQLGADPGWQGLPDIF